jgi:carbon storage regulator
MLVLTRRTGERIVIGGAVTITVLWAKNGRMRMGIEAPQGVEVLRGELLDRGAARVRGRPLAKSP